MIVLYIVMAVLMTILLLVALQQPVWNMPVIGIFAGCLVALSYLIARQLKRNIQKDSAPGSESFMPKYEQTRKFVLIMGFVALALGAAEIYSLLNPSDSRRVTRLTQMLHDMIGPVGAIVVFVGSGVAILLSAWRRKK